MQDCRNKAAQWIADKSMPLYPENTNGKLKKISKTAISVYEVIKKHFNETGIAPTWTEIQEALNLKTGRGVDLAIKALEQAGLIQRIPKKHRGIVIVDSTENNLILHHHKVIVKSKKNYCSFISINIGDELVIANYTKIEANRIYIGYSIDDPESPAPYKTSSSSGSKLILNDEYGNVLNWPNSNLRLIGILEAITKKVNVNA